MCFLIQNPLIKMCHAPAERNIKLKKLCQFISGLLCICISPGLEWCDLFTVSIQCHIPMHHGADTNCASGL